MVSEVNFGIANFNKLILNFAETLRINPAFGMISRQCTETIEVVGIKDKRVQIEAGTIVMIPVWSIHHDEAFYPEPETFDPDRFSEENGGVKKYRDAGVFLAWGAGPRTCLGKGTRFCVRKI